MDWNLLNDVKIGIKLIISDVKRFVKLDGEYFFFRIVNISNVKNIYSVIEIMFNEFKRL